MSQLTHTTWLQKVAELNELKDHPNFKRLGAPHKKDPAAEVRTPTSHGTKPEGKGKYGVEGGKFVSPASEGASASMKKSLDTLFYMKQLAEEGRLKPKQKRNIRKSVRDHILKKKQGVPEGVDPAKHERCVMDVKADGKDKSSAYAICNSSMNKADERLEKFLSWRSS